MIARELTEFFAAFAPRAHAYPAPDDPTFLSNVNAAYRRACWEEIRFDDVAVQRGPGVRPRAGRASALAQGLPPAAPRVLHAHDYSPVEFMRRYFDEYRGLRETIDHVEPFGAALVAARRSRAQVAADRALHARARV